MNPAMPPMPPMPSLWQEARNADGRVYYYNVQTKATQWNKPFELMTPLERSLANQPWKEYTAEGGRKYWYNTETKQSSWEMPEVYKNALAQHAQSQQQPPAPQFVAGGTSTLPPTGPRHDRERDHHHRDRDDFHLPERRPNFLLPSANGAGPFPPAAAMPAQDEPGYATSADAEDAFMKTLRRHNVQPDWSWEQAIRATIRDPQFRAIKDPRDRRMAFEKYAAEARAQEREKARERFGKLREDFNKMLRSHDEIRYYSRWKTIRPIIEGETIFRSTSDEEERKQLFGEYIIELRRQHAEEEAAARKAAKDDLVRLLDSLSLEPYTRWAEAQELIENKSHTEGSVELDALTRCDILTAFENHIKTLERQFNDARQQQKQSKQRKERKNREAFVGLLQELKSQGKIKAGTKWKETLPLFEDDPRYEAMLGQSGSSPLELFWDVIEEEERALRGPRNDILDVLDDVRFEIAPKTTYDEFLALMQSDRRTARIDDDILHLIFERLHDKVLRRSEDEKHAADRQQRRAVDALRSRIKHLEPPVRVSDTWEDVSPRVEDTEEYLAVDTEDLRRAAFEKVIRRLKEKEEDLERDRSSRREHDRRDREREREREHRHRKASRYSSRSPEPDPYEADRRKATAERERNYRRGSDLSPAPRERREERSREKERDRYRERSREHRHSRYERGEREHPRDLDRDDYDRFYRSRADPRSRGEELDYGGDSAVTTPTFAERRKRRDSEVESVASRKRSRREEGNSGEKLVQLREQQRAVAADAEKKGERKEREEEKAVHSGSEEGEIEED